MPHCRSARYGPHRFQSDSRDADSSSRCVSAFFGCEGRVIGVGSGKPHAIIPRLQGRLRRPFVQTMALLRGQPVRPQAMHASETSRSVGRADAAFCGSSSANHAMKRPIDAMSGRVTRPFSYKPLGVFCAIGGRNAVAEILGQRISGFFAWFMWRSVYLLRLPSSVAPRESRRRTGPGTSCSHATSSISRPIPPSASRVPTTVPVTSSSDRASRRSTSIRWR